MSVRFQSPEYFEAVNAALQADPAVLGAAKGKNVAVQIVTTRNSQEPIKTFLKIIEGIPQAGLGELDSSDAVITQDYQTAAALDRGELNAQNAFMQGKIKIKGNLMKMLQLQAFLQTLEAATAGIEREY